MAFLWDDIPGYAIGIEDARHNLELLVPFRTDGLGEAHGPELLIRLQQLGLAKGVEAVEVEEWADNAFLVMDAATGTLVAVLGLKA